MSTPAYAADISPSTIQPESSRAGEGEDLPECVPVLQKGAHDHDGFFARFASGIAFEFAQVGGSATGRTAIRGYGLGDGVWIGGTPFRGLVVGGDLWTARISPTFTEHGVLVTPDDDSVKETLAAVGPFVDWYPNPTRGFHMGGASSLALEVESDTKGNSIKPATLGASVSIGAGYEWFISDNGSIGFEIRFAMARGARAPSTGVETSTWEVPDLSLVYTYH